MDLERFAWGGAYGINLAERVGEPGELAQLQAAYGMIMNGLGNRRAAARYLDAARKLASENRSRHPLGEGLVLQLNGTLHMFWDDPEAGLADLDESIRICRSAGGMWELLTSLGTQGQLLFLLSRFEESAEKYTECGELARELNSTVHMGWKHCKASFCRYLIGEPAPELRATVREELFQAIALSIQAEDLMNHLIATAHLAVIARHEGDAAEAARLAVEILEINRRYKVNVPHVKLALVDAADAALFAADTLESGQNRDGAGSIGLSRGELLKIAATAIYKARALGKTFPYLRGPAERARARYIQLTKGDDAAWPFFERAMQLLDQTPHLWERGQAYAAAADTLSEQDPRRSQLLTRAAEIFRSANIQAELAQLPAAYRSQQATVVAATE